KSCAISMHKRIAKLASFMDGTRSFRCHMAWNTARERELAEEFLHSVNIFGDIGIGFRISAFQIGIRHHARATVTGAADIQHIFVALFNDAVEMYIDEVQTGCSAPMA